MKDKNLISGSTSMLLLKLLEEKDMYGYEMIDTLMRRSNQVFSMKAGTLYPLLHLLEEKNYLISYEKEAGGKIRKYYQLTKDGQKALKDKTREWKEYASAVTNVLSLGEVIWNV
ncbi:MAG TPA: PadR family transcriptional regulator [Lachnospiraceae bacterium]|nr:PadR family transcriptional regulator [Lachnospiraceae bacterium]HPF29193.1 PadR family transcriptional regulator [Lachnospiraceae bacterium]